MAINNKRMPPINAQAQGQSSRVIESDINSFSYNMSSSGLVPPKRFKIFNQSQDTKEKYSQSSQEANPGYLAHSTVETITPSDVEYDAKQQTEERVSLSDIGSLYEIMRGPSLSNLRPEILGSLDWIPRNVGQGMGNMLDVRTTLRKLIQENVLETITRIESPTAEFSHVASQTRYAQNNTGLNYSMNDAADPTIIYETKVQVVQAAGQHHHHHEEPDSIAEATLVAPVEEEVEEPPPPTFAEILEVADKKQHAAISAAYEMHIKLETAKKALDIKDNDDELAVSVLALMNMSITNLPVAGRDLSIRSLFVNELMFSQSGYAEFCNTKVLGQMISDLRGTVFRYSPMLLAESASNRSRDSDSIKLVSSLPNGNRSGPEILNTSKSHRLTTAIKAGDTSRYQEYVNGFPTAIEDRVKYLIMMLSREITVSCGLGIASTTTGSSSWETLYKASEGGSSINKALGVPKSNILDDVVNDGSLADQLLFAEELGDKRLVLPFETRAFKDDKNEGRYAIPGSAFFIDSILHLPKMQHGRSILFTGLATNYKKVVGKSMSYSRRLLNLGDNGFNGHPASVYLQALNFISQHTSTIKDGDRAEQDQLLAVSIFLQCNKDVVLRRLVYAYILMKYQWYIYLVKAQKDDGGDRNNKDGEEEIKPPDQLLDLAELIANRLYNNSGRFNDNLREAVANDAALYENYGIEKQAVIDMLTDPNPAQRNLFNGLIGFVHAGIGGTIQTIMNAEARTAHTTGRGQDSGSSAYGIPTNGGDKSLMKWTKFNKWGEDEMFLVAFEIFLAIIFKHLPVVDSYKIETTSKPLYLRYNSKDAQSFTESAYYAELKYTTTNTGGLSLSGWLNGTLSGVTGDIAAFLGEFINETQLAQRLIATIASTSLRLATAATDVAEYFQLIDGTAVPISQPNLARLSQGTQTSQPVAIDNPILLLRQWLNPKSAADVAGQKLLQSISTQQLVLLNVANRKWHSRPEDTSFLPSDQTSSPGEIHALKVFLDDPSVITYGAKADNIRTLVVGLPIGLHDTLKNPTYEIESGETTEITTTGNVIKVIVYKRDVEYEELKFKPKEYLYDMSAFLLPSAFDDLEQKKLHTFQEVIDNATFTYYSDGDTISDSLDHHGMELTRKNDSNVVLEKYTSFNDDDLRRNHTIDRLLQTYYSTLFGLEMDELTFVHDDVFLELHTDNSRGEAKGSGLDILRDANDNPEFPKEWLKTGRVPLYNMHNMDADAIGAQGLLPDELQRPLTSYDAIDALTPNGSRAPRMKEADLTMFRSLLASRIFNMDSSYIRFLAPKLFDRVFMIPVDPDEFEIDMDATVDENTNPGGKEFIDSDIFSEMSEKVSVNRGGKWVEERRLIPRPPTMNYCSLNQFFVQISTVEPGDL